VTVSILLAFGSALSLAASAGAANPVLDAKEFAAPYGKGFGTAEPAEIFNGGDRAARPGASASGCPGRA
jgi:hypothetical protein